MSTPIVLSDRISVLEEKVEAVTTRMGTLEVDLKTLTGEVHDGFARVDAEFAKVGDEMQTGFRALQYQINTTANRFEAALRASEDRIITTTDERREAALQATEQRVDGRVQAAVLHAEQRLDERIEVAEKGIDERMQAAIQASEDRTHAAIKAGDEETRRYMRALHEDVLERISVLGGRHPSQS